MNRIKTILKSHWFWLFFFFFSSLIYFKPFLLNPSLNLIDDGVSIRNSMEIINGDFKSLLETKIGRIRPIYWLYYSFIYLLSGTNPLGYWIGQIIVFSLSLYTTWKIINKNNGVFFKTVSGLFLTTFFFIPSISENLYRLGTAEVRQMLLILLFTNWMVELTNGKTKKWYGVVLFILALFSKEISIMLLPMAIVYFTPHILINLKKYKRYSCLLLFFTTFSIIFYYLIASMQKLSTYSSNQSFNITQMKNNLLISRLGINEIYYILFILLLFTTIRLYFVVKNFRRKEFLNKTLFFLKDNALILTIITGLFSSLFFILTWKYQLGRYYYNLYFLLFIYLFIETKKIIKMIQEKNNIKTKMLFFITPIILSTLLYFTFFQKTFINLNKSYLSNLNIKNQWVEQYQSNYGLIQYILNENISIIFTTINDYESIYEIGLYLNKFNYISNKKSVYSSNNKLALKYKYIEFSDMIVTDFISSNNKNKLLITKDSNLELDRVIYQKTIIKDNNDNNTKWIIWKYK